MEINGVKVAPSITARSVDVDFMDQVRSRAVRQPRQKYRQRVSQPRQCRPGNRSAVLEVTIQTSSKTT